MLGQPPPRAEGRLASVRVPIARLAAALVLAGALVVVVGVVTADGSEFVGDDSDETIHGTIYADTLAGSGGDDFIRGDRGTDTLTGDAGADTILGDESSLSTRSARDSIDGGDGVDELAGGGDSDVVNGGGGDDLIGSIDFARIHGPTLAERGHDQLSGQGGNDFVYAGPNDDTVDGGAGDDNLYGGPQDDTVDGGTGRDSLIGEDGNDRMLARDGAGIDFVTCGPGTDVAIVDHGDTVLADCESVERPPTPTPTPTPPQPPTQPPATVPDATQLDLPGKAKLSRKGVVNLEVSCPAGFSTACKGVVKLTSAKKLKLGAKAKKVSLGKAKFGVPPGRSEKAKVKLAARTLKALGRGSKVKAKATVVLDTPIGRSKSTEPLTLKR